MIEKNGVIGLSNIKKLASRGRSSKGDREVTAVWEENQERVVSGKPNE